MVGRGVGVEKSVAMELTLERALFEGRLGEELRLERKEKLEVLVGEETPDVLGVKEGM